MEYTNTSLWESSLGIQDKGNEHLTKQLREAFERARNNASFLLEKIRIDFPSLTVHDITHVDSLWQVGSVIAGENYDINPLEGFVLGCAFLMHDAVLSFDAAGGKATLRNTLEWKDFYSDYKENTSLTAAEQQYETDFRTIRLLHAKYAKNLYDKLFTRDDGSSFFIIEDESLRTHFGPIICKIAASHHWNMDEVEGLGDQMAAPSDYPRAWRINPIKLACLLRCADAGHIDSGRAPDYLLKLLSVNGVSRSHWVAQNHLSQIDVDRNDREKVIITSNINFKEKDFAAWNVACDAVRVLDHEIKNSNELLKKNNIPLFQAKGVSGSGSRRDLSNYIRTEGWQPYDADIHISNVEGLINDLGGEKLYGKGGELGIVMRELIQNARDSIVARRQREPGFDGKICIDIEENEGKTWITVKDDGVGMSMQTIKDYFLNFGSSFWSSDLAKSEFPGLSASGFKSVGTFGIGFYSIFMVASEVIVETRKFDQGLDANIVLKFPTGLCLRPIIAHERGKGTFVSTIVRFALDEKKCKWEPYVDYPYVSVPYALELSKLTVGLDVDVYYTEQGNSQQKVHTNIESPDFDVAQWLKDITFAQYYKDSKYIDYIDNNYKRVKKIYHQGKYYGMAALNTSYDSYDSEGLGKSYDPCPSFQLIGIRSIGGLACFNHYLDDKLFLGYVLSEPETASRKTTYLSSDWKVEWVKKQYQLLTEQGLTDEDKLRLPYIIGPFGVVDLLDVMKIRVADVNDHKKTYELSQLLLMLRDTRKKLVIPISSIPQPEQKGIFIDHFLDYERTIKLLDSDELLLVIEQNSGILSISFSDLDSDSLSSMLDYLLSCAKKLSLRARILFEKNKSYSRISFNGHAIVISVE